ncbi:MAG: acyltransferase [Sphingobacteriales bacterium]|nr:MAG: acyltransferase [Sphingobacteriales bacterium]
MLALIPVVILRGERLLPGYFIFVQNFFTKIPYFLVSWSLCVEEHFYVFFPIFICLLKPFRKRSLIVILVWVALIVVPILLRSSIGNNSDENFGYYHTASFFRYDGIAIGCLLSFFIHKLKVDVSGIKRYQYFIISFIIIMLIATELFKGSRWVYTLGYSLLSISIGLLLLLFYARRSFIVSSNYFVKFTASMAYSIYLTHAIVIHLVLQISRKFNLHPLAGSIMCFCLIFFIARIFYLCIEKPSIKMRNRLLGTNKSFTSRHEAMYFIKTPFKFLASRRTN